MSGVKIINGNIFNTQCQTIVNTVNCVGVMGKGIALVFKLRYPSMFEEYKTYCENGSLTIGKLWLYKKGTPWVLNFPTKDHWKYPSEYNYISLGLEKFVNSYKRLGITSIAFPMLGTANGGLDESIILPMMQEYLSHCDIPVEIYKYDSNVTDDLFESFKLQWESIPNYSKKDYMGIRTQKQLETIDYALHDDNVKSMIQLINYPGIGIKTLENCYQSVISFKKQPTLF